MQYIPENNIVKGFYSDRDFFINKTTNLYIGPYWTLLDGTPYTGETFSPESSLLIPVSEIIGEDNVEEIPDNFLNDDTAIFNYLNNTVRDVPQPYNLILNQSEKKLDTINRYFVKKTDKYQYFEINYESFSLIKSGAGNIAWDRYSAVQLSWAINGDSTQVNRINKQTVKEIEMKFSTKFPNGKLWLGFSTIFKNNYLQFYQGVITNLSTLGNEYKTKDGKEYMGPYHIHPEKGPMVGAEHVMTPHDYLYPIKRKIKPTQQNIIPQTPSPTYTPPTPPGGGISGGGGGGGY